MNHSETPIENRYNATSTSQQYPPPKHGGRVPNINSAAALEFSSRPHGMYADGKSIFAVRQSRGIQC